MKKKENYKKIALSFFIILFIVYIYNLLENLFTPDGVELMRKFYHQGGISNLKIVFQNLPFWKTFINSITQGIIFLIVFAAAIKFRPYLENLTKFITSMPPNYFLAAIFIAAFSIILGIFYFYSRFFPTSGDANAYLFQAKILLKGKLTVPSPLLKEFFSADYIINNGKMYGQYPIGTSFMLAFGEILGISWVIPPLLASFALIFIYFIAFELYDEKIARFAALFLIFTPLFQDMPASYLSHTPQLFFSSVFVYFFIRATRYESLWNPIISGMGLGMALNTRPLTALTVSIPFIVWGIILLFRDCRKYGPKILLIILGFIPFFIILLLINYIQNGKPLLFGHTVYMGPNYVNAGFGNPEYGVLQASTSLLFRLRLMMKTLIKPPLTGIFVLLFLILSFIKKERREYNILFWAAFLITLAGYFPMATNVWEYRYYFTPAIMLLILLPVGISGLGDWLEKRLDISSSSLLSAFLILTIVSWTKFTIRRGLRADSWVTELKLPYDLAKEQKISNSLIFVREVKWFYPEWYCRNTPDFNGSILWVMDLKEKNKELMDRYANRSAYIYENGKFLKIK